MRTYFVLLLRQGGTSFVEMTLAVTVLSILTALALPSVYDLMNNSTIRSKRHALLQDIRTLRFRAISRRRPAYMCALDSEGICASQMHWNEGWMGYIDNNLNGKYDEGDERVLQQAKSNKSFSVDIIFHARWRNIKFDGRGILRRSGHFRICNPDIIEKQRMKVIRMNTFGRLAVETDTLLCN